MRKLLLRVRASPALDGRQRQPGRRTRKKGEGPLNKRMRNANLLRDTLSTCAAHRRRNGGAGVYFARTGPVDLGARVWFQRHVGFIATRDLSCPVGKRRRGHPESRQAVSSSSAPGLQGDVTFH